MAGGKGGAEGRRGPVRSAGATLPEATCYSARLGVAGGFFNTPISLVVGKIVGHVLGTPPCQHEPLGWDRGFPPPGSRRRL